MRIAVVGMSLLVLVLLALQALLAWDGDRPPALPQRPPKWKPLISGETVEQEVRRAAAQLEAAAAERPPERKRLSELHRMLSVMLELASEHEGRVPWKRSQAAGQRDLHLKAHSSLTKNMETEASRTAREQLQKLLAGKAVELSGKKSDWHHTDYTGIMLWQRDVVDRLDRRVTGQRIIARHQTEILRDLESLRACSEILALPAYRFHGEADYHRWQRAFRAHIEGTAQAVTKQDLPAALRGIHRIKGCCSQCHNLYR